jgi:hypothetical protein
VVVAERKTVLVVLVGVVLVALVAMLEPEPSTQAAAEAVLPIQVMALAVQA